VHRTFGTRRLFLTEPAALQPHSRILQKLETIIAQAVSMVMPVAAKNSDHSGHRFPFPRQPRIGQVICASSKGSHHIWPGEHGPSAFHVGYARTRWTNNN
jgi:hypothetical protein